jgi:hypothetical protein
MFDLDSFLNSDTVGANSTEYTPVPEGEYPAQIKKVTARVTERGQTIVDVQWGVQDEKAAEVTGMKEPVVRQSIFLDLTETDNIDLGKGKNVQLGKLRDAVGQNDPSRPWNFNMLVGQAAKIRTSHRIGDQGQIYVDVKAVTRL